MTFIFQKNVNPFLGVDPLGVIILANIVKFSQTLGLHPVPLSFQGMNFIELLKLYSDMSHVLFSPHPKEQTSLERR